MHKFISVPGKTYTFTVRAFTSAGDGPGSTVTLLVEPQGMCVQYFRLTFYLYTETNSFQK